MNTLTSTPICECGERLHRDRGGLKCLNEDCVAYWFAPDTPIPREPVEPPCDVEPKEDV